MKEEYEEALHLKKYIKSIKNTVDGAFENWKLWGLYFPLVIFVAAFIMVSYFYMVNVQKWQKKINVLSARINSVYEYAPVIRSFGIIKENQTIFRGL